MTISASYTTHWDSIEASDLFRAGSISVVAPAGHGKTELITRIAALGNRTLILTHTHAGVHAIRERLRRHGVPSGRCYVDTIAGWCMKYARAFPGLAKPPPDLPKSAGEWDQLYQGVSLVLDIAAIRGVVAASYDQILIDEYQDCGAQQHGLGISLASIVPTIVFGDPMQGIFEFAGAKLGWPADVFPHFPLAGTLDSPHRWANKNAALGQWIAEVREALSRGDTIDLQDERINFRISDSTFDMATLFESLTDKEGTCTAIHCNKTVCYKLARAANGGYQAIEEVAANRLVSFATDWDSATSGRERLSALKLLLTDAFHIRDLTSDDPAFPQAQAVMEEIAFAVEGLSGLNGAHSARRILALCRTHPGWKLYRSGLWRDTEIALDSVGSERSATMIDAVSEIRQRTSQAGRKLPTRVVSTPLLLKGLEFDHVIIPDATHFARERLASAKLFYVSISRATTSLTISSSSRYLKFDTPLI